MPSEKYKTAAVRRRFAAAVMFLAAFAIWGWQPAAGSSAADRVLHLSAAEEQYFLGPYLDHLEDREKRLTIGDVSSAQMSARFVQHSEKLLNLGMNPYAYWIRFKVRSSIPKKKWLLFFGWPNAIDHATLYTPATDGRGWIEKEVGRILPSGPDALPSRPADFLPDSHGGRPVTIYLRVESTEVKTLPLKILTDDRYQRISKRRLLFFGVYWCLLRCHPGHVFVQSYFVHFAERGQSSLLSAVPDQHLPPVCSR